MKTEKITSGQLQELASRHAALTYDDLCRGAAVRHFRYVARTLCDRLAFFAELDEFEVVVDERAHKNGWLDIKLYHGSIRVWEYFQMYETFSNHWVNKVDWPGGEIFWDDGELKQSLAELDTIKRMTSGVR